MKKNTHLTGWISAIVLFGLSITLVLSQETREPVDTLQPASRPALNVAVVRPANIDMPLTLTANGSVTAWQEAIIGARVSSLRLDEVRVQVGEKVHKGQILAVFDKKPLLAEVAQSKAALAEADANLAEAGLNADRARQIAASGALSDQQVMQYLTAEKTARAKRELAKAQLDNRLLQLSHTDVVAIDDGIVSSRTATLGAVATPEQELFRLIRQNRLEWRAEVTAAEMAQLKPGIGVSVSVPDVGRVDGKVRFLAPALDTQSRNGLVYVDLADAAAAGLRAGMFAQGEFRLGSKSAWTIPQSALSLREGFSYVFVLHDQSENQAKVSQVKVRVGQRAGDSYEVSGLEPDVQLVADGAAFLADGDSIRVVQ